MARKTSKWSDIKEKKLSPEARDRIEREVKREVRELELKEETLSDVSRETLEGVLVEDARSLFTVGEEAVLWEDPQNSVTALEQWKGSIVRLRPPTDVEDETVERLRALIAERGAAKVIVMPKPKGVVVPNEAAPPTQLRREGARVAVMRLVAESNSSNREKLREICERVMSEAGL